jgi:hypothetical protein
MSVHDYLDALTPDRRESLTRVRDTILRNLPAGYEENISFGMITYSVPLSRYPDTYNGQPLMYCGLASQKSYLSLYLLPAYGSEALAERLREGFRSAGKKLDMGKSCIRFRTADDLQLDVIGAIVAAVPVDKWVEIAETARAGAKSRPRKAAAKRASGRKATAKRAKPKKRR